MPLIDFALAFVCLLLAVGASMTRRALRDFSMHELGQLGQRHHRPNRLSAILRWQERVAQAADLVHVAALVSAAALAARGFFSIDQPRGGATWAATLGFAAALLLLAILCDVWVAAPLARITANRFLFHNWIVLQSVAALLTPFTAITHAIEQALFRLTGAAPKPPSEETLEDEIRTIVTEGQREGLLEEDAREMIEGVIEMGDVDVGEIMTPRTDMLMLHHSSGLNDAAEFFVKAGHSRIPVYDKSRDDITGILYSKDLLAELIKPAAVRVDGIARLLRPPAFVPESKPIDDLLQEFQHQRNHIAIVLNEFGGVAGLVTIEDILEEIVGEIVDEHDEEVDQRIRRIDERTCEVPARAKLEDINEQLGLGIEENGVDTIGGFVFAELGHVPRPGEQLIWKNLKITVLDVRHRRIERVRLETLDAAHSQSA